MRLIRSILILTMIITTACNLSNQPATETAPSTTDEAIIAPADTSTPTVTPLPTDTPQPIVEAADNSVEVAANQASCTVRTDLPTYTVASGDTLFAIAQHTNSTIAQLTEYNCLNDVNTLQAGTILHIPQVSQSSTNTGTTASSSQDSTANQSAPPVTSGQGQITQFAITPRSVERGGSFTVTWAVTGASDEIMLRAEGSDYRGGIVLARNLSASGSRSVSFPVDNVFYLTSGKVWLQSGALVSEQIPVQVACPWQPLVGTQCPENADSAATITYQSFENGFMLAYRGQVMILQDGGYVLWFNPAENTPPDKLAVPANVFLAAWKSVDLLGTPIYEIIGGAATNAQTYTGTWQQLPHLRDAGTEYITLPDGRILVIHYSFRRAVSWEIR